MMALPSLRWTSLRLAVWVLVVTAATHTASLTTSVVTSSNPTWPPTPKPSALLTLTTVTATTLDWCGGIEACLANAGCSQCLRTLNRSATTHSLADWQRLSISATSQLGLTFLDTLTATPMCATQVTAPALLSTVLSALGTAECAGRYGMLVDGCSVAEYNCFANSTSPCKECYSAVSWHRSGQNGSVSEILASPACEASNLSPLQHTCIAFPKCSYAKHICQANQSCAACLDTLRSGDGAAAAQQCPATPNGRPEAYGPLDFVATVCLGNSASGCSYFTQRCTDYADCAGCAATLAPISGEDKVELARALATPACRRAAADSWARGVMKAVVMSCPNADACKYSLINTWYVAPELLVQCFLGSRPPENGTSCASLFTIYKVSKECRPCPASIATVNNIVLATTAVGGFSCAVCLWVAATIIAHGRHRRATRDRIVLGLMLSNAVYSLANAIPLNLLHDGNHASCGDLALSFTAIRLGRAAWFGSKYGLVAFELLIVGASLWALQALTAGLGRRTEAALHTLCFLVGTAAFVGFYTRCAQINAAGYNAEVERSAFADSFDHLSESDDLNDDSPSVATAAQFEAGRAAYDQLVREMLMVWNFLAGLTVLLWVAVRLFYRRALQQLRKETVETAAAEANDEWAATRRSGWVARRGVLQAQQLAFADVAQPLEPFLAVFVVFLAPAVAMSTHTCQANSGAVFSNRADSTAIDDRDTKAKFGLCDVGCEFALAFRSLATVAVYLASRERRREFVTFRGTCSGMSSCCTGADERDTSEGTPESESALVEMGVLNQAETAHSTEWQIDESAIEKQRIVGNGAHGEVWAGTLVTEHSRPRVAIKTLFGGMRDEDGDPIDPNADAEFQKEVAALQCVHHPHLLRFFGFGTTSEGNGFLVTELMEGGSLEAALHDTAEEMAWKARISIGLQVAQGMTYLHQLHLIHRDLKSANVLLDAFPIAATPVAKVCDFGLTRLVKPVSGRTTQSSFTGVRRELPVPAVSIRTARPGRRFSVTIDDPASGMTKAAGTLLWMAPEVFRGDCVYTSAVDVYSFGVVLYELATRQTPWTELNAAESDLEFFGSLNRALQTGERPRVPEVVEAAYPEFVAVMEGCWVGDPADRPTFTAVAADLAACLRWVRVS